MLAGLRNVETLDPLPQGGEGWSSYIRFFHSVLPAANYVPPTAYCLLPTAYCLLPTAYCLLWLLATIAPEAASGHSKATSGPSVGLYDLVS